MSSLGVLVEHLARLWVAAERPGLSRTLWGRPRCAVGKPAPIDLLALAPLFLTAAAMSGLLGAGAVDAEALRLARLLRVLRILRLGRFAQATLRLAQAAASRRFDLGAMPMVAGLLLASSTPMHFVESEAQPETFGSIPRATWWSIATPTTVGYGAVTPVAAMGRVFAGITAIIGIGLIAMQTGIRPESPPRRCRTRSRPSARPRPVGPPRERARAMAGTPGRPTDRLPRGA